MHIIFKSRKVKTAVIAAQGGVESVLNIVMAAILSRELSVTTFGIYRKVMLLVTTAKTILPFGFPLSSIYLISSDSNRDDSKRIVVTNLCCLLLIAFSFILLMLLAGFFNSWSVLGVSISLNAYLIMLLICFSSIIGASFSQCLYGYGKHMVAAICSLIFSLLGFFILLATFFLIKI